ncbi:MAG TPA: hypothetical protein VL727_11190 [Puia sp.]|nr:hypothetical protein [Puia sp.]
MGNAKIIPFFRLRYETHLSPVQVLERIRDNVAKPEWAITTPKLIQYSIITGKITGNEFEVSNTRYGLTYGRMNYLLIMKGSVQSEKQSGVTSISLIIQPPTATTCFYIIFSALMILLARYAIRHGDVMLAVFSIIFVVVPYLSLVFQLPKSIHVYRRFIEQDILNR